MASHLDVTSAYKEVITMNTTTITMETHTKESINEICKNLFIELIDLQILESEIEILLITGTLGLEEAVELHVLRENILDKISTLNKEFDRLFQYIS